MASPGAGAPRGRPTVDKEGLGRGPEGRFRGVKTSEGGHRWVTTRDIPQGSFGPSRPNALAWPAAGVYSQEILANYLS